MKADRRSFKTVPISADRRLFPEITIDYRQVSFVSAHLADDTRALVTKSAMASRGIETLARSELYVVYSSVFSSMHSFLADWKFSRTWITRQSSLNGIPRSVIDNLTFHRKRATRLCISCI